MNKDLTPVVFGVLVSTALAGTLVIAGLKAGITPGVSPLVILVAWGVFQKRVAAAGYGSRFLNLAQVAGSAGMAVTAGVIFTAPLIQILYASKGLAVPSVDVVTLIVVSLAGALIGFGFVGLATEKFLSDPTLPAPEARACETMIRSATTKKGERPRLGRSLYLGMVSGFLAPLLAHLGFAHSEVGLFARAQEDGSRSASVGLPFAPIYIGIGGLLTIGTALLVFGGSFVRLAGDLLLAGVEAGTQQAARYPANSMRWVGGGAMTVAVAYSLLKFVRVRLPIGAPGESDLIEVDPDRKRLQAIAVGVGLIILLGWLFSRGASFQFSAVMALAVLLMSMLMVSLGAILSLQIGSSASPVSGTIFVTTLVLCLAALSIGHNRIDDVVLLTPLLVGACVAVCTANDSSQDYKTLQLCGMRVQDGFLAQLLGLVGGAIIVPIVLYVAHEAYTLGSVDLPAPQGVMFATLIDGLLLQGALPWAPIGIGLAIGLAAVLLDAFAERRGMQLPSMALAVGIYLPADIGIGILLGATARRIAEGRRPQTHESILSAAGLITGAAALDLILGVLIIAIAGFQPESLAIWSGGGAFPNVVTALGILFLCGILWRNSRLATK